MCLPRCAWLRSWRSIRSRLPLCHFYIKSKYGAHSASFSRSRIFCRVRFFPFISLLLKQKTREPFICWLSRVNIKARDGLLLRLCCIRLFLGFSFILGGSRAFLPAHLCSFCSFLHRLFPFLFPFFKSLKYKPVRRYNNSESHILFFCCCRLLLPADFVLLLLLLYNLPL